MDRDYDNVRDVWVHRAYKEALINRGFVEFHDYFKESGLQQLQKPRLALWRQRIQLSMNTPQGPQCFYLKRYTRPPLRWQLRRLSRGAPATAQIEFERILQVAGTGIEVPLPIACGARMAGPLERASFIMTRELPGMSLERWLAQPERFQHLRRDQQLRVARQIAELVKLLHGSGFVHRDLYAAHIFIEGPENGAMRLFLLDLQRVLKPRWRHRRWRIKDLAALNYSIPSPLITTSMRLRWLKHYLGAEGQRHLPRSLVRDITAKTTKIARHSRKHGLG